MNRTTFTPALILAGVAAPLGALCSETVRNRLSDTAASLLAVSASVFFVAAASWLIGDVVRTHVKGPPP